MLPFIFASFALAASALPQRARLATRDSTPGSWALQAYVPTPDDAGAYEFHNNRTNWTTLDSGTAGFEFDLDNGDKLAWRRKGDDASGAVIELAKDNNMISYNVTYGDGGISLWSEGSVSTDFNSSGGANQRRDLWDGDSGFGTLPIAQTFSVLNSMCDPGLNFTITSIDADGQITTKSGTDNIGGFPVPTKQPATIDVKAEGSTSAMTVVFNGKTPLSVKYGSGDNVPIVSASMNSEVQYCPD